MAQNPININIEGYLKEKGISYREANGELVCRCFINNCDKDSKGNEAHLYFDKETGQYHCKKCGETGNIYTLMKFFGDKVSNQKANSKQEVNSAASIKSVEIFDPTLVETCHLALPEDKRKYLNNRGIPNDTIDDYKLGWGKFYGEFWITIPIKNSDNEYYFFKLRQDPAVGNKKITYPNGIEAQIYGWEILNQGGDLVVICEGELDRLLLISHGVPAITSTHGAGTFKEAWVEALANFDNIYLCYDLDNAGKDGAARIIKSALAHNLEARMFNIILPESLGESGDVTNYFTEFGGDVDTFFALAKPVKTKPDRVMQVKPGVKTISFDEWQQVIKRNFPELIFPAEMGLSVISQILIIDVTNPFALVLIDVPSSGKTITINFYDRIEGITYSSDKFTTASFVSNAANVKPELLPQIDLLPKLQYKTFLLRDLATVFSKKEDDLKDALGTLTRVLDGEGLNTDTGVHGGRHYEGEYLFMMLAASTPIPQRIWKTMSSLGSRLFFLRMNSRAKSEDELAEQVVSTSHKIKEQDCRKATKNFLMGLWQKYPQGVDWDKSKDDINLVKIISRCARMLARLRGVLGIWKKYNFEDKEEFDYSPPVIEQPDRINQLFYNLACGHALVSGRLQIQPQDLRFVIELMIDSAPNTRAHIVRKLLDNKGILTTEEVMAALSCSRPTALQEMEVLKILGVCDISDHESGTPGQPLKFIKLLPEFEWFLSEECKIIRTLNNTQG